MLLSPILSAGCYLHSIITVFTHEHMFGIIYSVTDIRTLIPVADALNIARRIQSMLDSRPLGTFPEYTGTSADKASSLVDEIDEDALLFTHVSSRTVLVPRVQSMQEYILKHHKRMVLSALNQQIRSGMLSSLSISCPESFVLKASNCTFDYISLRLEDIAKVTVVFDHISTIIRTWCITNLSFRRYIAKDNAFSQIQK